MRTLNLGVVAHVDAGKTSLTERLLYAGGVIDEIGSVDDGSTQTDSLALERQRGITIKSAVVSFDIGDVSVNLIDTPGHPDFIAEVERVLSVLDGAVLVVSAVEGVQAQTRVLMRTLRRLGIPTLVFVNKIDRGGARDRDVVDAISARLAPGVAMTSVADLGTRAATSTPLGADDAEHTAQLVDLLADHDSAFLAAYVDGDAAVSYRRLRAELTELTRRCLVHPVFFGSAITGAGVDDLIAGVHDFLPSGQADWDAPVSGSVFKIERGPAGEKIAFTRMFAGTIRVRDRVRVGAREGKVTAVRVFEHGAAAQRPEVSAGGIAALWGLADARIGDTVGAAGDTALTGTDAHHFAPPTLETVVDPVSAADRGRLLVALTQLAEQDPLIDLRQDDIRQEVFVSLYGEVQKEVIGSTLADEYGIDVTFRETTTICVERPTGVGEAVELIGTAMNPFLATVGLRVEAGEVESGVRFDLGVELGSMPSAFFAGVDEALGKAVQQGLHGWPLTDAVVTLTHSGYWARQSHAHGTFDASMSSTAGDFRNLTPLVLMDALRRAGTVVCEPVHRFRLEVPADLLSPALSALSRLQGVPLAPQLRDAVYVLEGDIPAARIHELQQLLPSVSRGEGMLESAFERYEPVHGVVPTRARTDLDPLHRDEYVRRVTRRV